MARPSNTYLLASVVILGLLACGTNSAPNPTPTPIPASTPTTRSSIASGPGAPEPALASGDHADVIRTSISGNPGSYRFSVTVRSPDTGCSQYADWWEVLSPGGRLIYRRVLLHSHVGEQPFTRSGGPVNVQPDETVIIRGHMNGTGYGGVGLRGSVAGGFTTTELSRDFGKDLERREPLPSGCGF